MSATNRGAKREEQDNYQTPESTIELFYRFYEEETSNALHGCTVLEPCAGDGNFIKVAQRLAIPLKWSAGDIRPECGPTLEKLMQYTAGNQIWIGDFLKEFPEQAGPHKFLFDYCVTNPPFSLAMEFLEKCNKICKKTIMLLRVNFLGSKKRATFFKEHCPDVYVLSKRPSFTKGKTDSTEYAFFVFDNENPKSYGQIQVIGY